MLEDGQFWIAPTIKDQGHLDRLIASPLCVPIGDGFANHPEMHRAYGLMPKSFGTFPLVLGSYVRDRGVLTLEEAIHKITAEPARRLGLTDRGTLAAGAGRRPRGVRSRRPSANRATEADPAARPAGIDRVMVNGAWAVVGRPGDRRASRPVALAGALSGGGSNEATIASRIDGSARATSAYGTASAMSPAPLSTSTARRSPSRSMTQPTGSAVSRSSSDRSPTSPFSKCGW